MNIYKYYGWVILNVQLIIGIVYSYDSLHRHLIIKNVLFFVVFMAILANIFFKLFYFIRVQSFRSYIAFVASAYIVSIIAILRRYSLLTLEASDLIILFVFIHSFLLIFFTTPISILVEILLNYFKRKKLSCISKE